MSRSGRKRKFPADYELPELSSQSDDDGDDVAGLNEPLERRDGRRRQEGHRGNVRGAPEDARDPRPGRHEAQENHGVSEDDEHGEDELPDIPNQASDDDESDNAVQHVHDIPAADVVQGVDPFAVDNGRHPDDNPAEVLDDRLDQYDQYGGMEEEENRDGEDDDDEDVENIEGKLIKICCFFKCVFEKKILAHR